MGFLYFLLISVLYGEYQWFGIMGTLVVFSDTLAGMM
jgi:hypothetical protein